MDDGAPEALPLARLETAEACIGELQAAALQHRHHIEAWDQRLVVLTKAIVAATIRLTRHDDKDGALEILGVMHDLVRVSPSGERVPSGPP